MKEAAPDLDYRVTRPASTDDLVGAAINKAWNSVDIYEDEATLNRTLAPATPGQRAVLAARGYEGEVNNGGHDQYFFNSTGILWEDTLAGLALLGANEHRTLLERAVAQFPDRRPSKDRYERQDQLEKVDSALLDRLDTSSTHWTRSKCKCFDTSRRTRTSSFDSRSASRTCSARGQPRVTKRWKLADVFAIATP